jgi:hypothetical protein
MPYKTEKIAIADPFLNKRTKLLPCQKERIVDLYNGGSSINGLAKVFKVSKRLIQFTIFPERAELSKMKTSERQKNGRYYNKEKHTKSVRDHRRYKQELFKK